MLRESARVGSVALNLLLSLLVAHGLFYEQHTHTPQKNAPPFPQDSVNYGTLTARLQLHKTAVLSSVASILAK